MWRRTTLAEYRKADGPLGDRARPRRARRRRERELGLEGRDLPRPGAIGAAWSRSRAAAPMPTSCASSTRVDEALRRGRLRAARGEVRRRPGATPTRSSSRTDFGPGSLTESGYPRIVKRWRRGTPLAARDDHVRGRSRRRRLGRRGRGPHARATSDHPPASDHVLNSRATSCCEGDRWSPIDVPDDAIVGFMRDGWLLIELRSDWKVGGHGLQAAGSLRRRRRSTPILAGRREFDVAVRAHQTRSLAELRARRATASCSTCSTTCRAASSS